MLHTPKQTRSKKTLERILSAARNLMALEGVDSVGVTEIVAAADSSVGSFYARFDGKEDLVRVLHERLWAEASSRWHDGLEEWDNGFPAGDRVIHLVGMLQDTVQPDQQLRRALTRMLDEEGAAAQAAFEDRIVSDAVSLMHADEAIRHPKPPTAIALGTRFVLAVLRDKPGPLRWSHGGEDMELDSPGIRGELATALRGYWGVGTLVQIGPDPSDTAVEYFDIWS